jgi:hypothetical protein
MLGSFDLGCIRPKDAIKRQYECVRTRGPLTPLKAKIETLEAELAKLEAVAGGHRADFEWERDQGHKLMAEFLKMIAVTMTAKEASPRLEGELAALKARPWWRRLAG